MIDYFDIVRAILALFCITASAKLVLICLVDMQGKKGKCWPSVRTIQRRCGLSRPTVLKAITSLEKIGLVTAERPSKPSVKSSTRYAVNLELVKKLDHPTGKESLPEPVKKLDQSGDNRSQNLTSTGQESLPEPVKKLDHNVSLTSHETTQSITLSRAMQLAALLRDLILARQPKAREKRANLESWAEDIDKLLRIDQRTPEEIKAVIRWCQADSFWQGNIRSGRKLRDKFDQLEDSMNRPKGQPKKENTYDRDYQNRFSNVGETVAM